MRERVKQWRQKVTSFLEKHIKPQSIQMTIALSFTIVSVISMGILGISLYNRFVNKMEDMTTQSAEQLLNQTAINLESYLRNMRRISDAMYYSVIKDKDLATDSLDEEMNLLYEANKDNLISIACYTNDGRLVAAAPVATEKNNLDIVDQEWFTEATGQMENVHFSTPHVQNLFDDRIAKPGGGADKRRQFDTWCAACGYELQQYRAAFDEGKYGQCVGVCLSDGRQRGTDLSPEAEADLHGSVFGEQSCGSILRGWQPQGGI